MMNEIYYFTIIDYTSLKNMQYDELVFKFKIRLRQSVLDLVGIDTLNIGYDINFG
jgi:hypothetical protein